MLDLTLQLAHWMATISKVSSSSNTQYFPSIYKGEFSHTLIIRSVCGSSISQHVIWCSYELIKNVGHLCKDELSDHDKVIHDVSIFPWVANQLLGSKRVVSRTTHNTSCQIGIINSR